VRREFARWRLLTWQIRRDAARREFHQAWTGLDMNDAEKRAARAEQKIAKWQTRSEARA
jgi:hypothetical protein